MSLEILALGPPDPLEILGRLTVLLLMLQLAFGAVVCFCGYQIMRFLIGLSGFILGAGIFGLGAGLASGEELVAGIAALLGGVVGAVGALALYYVGIFLIGAGLGATLGLVGALVVDAEPYPPVLLLLAVATGVGALLAQKLFIVLSTALSGSWSMTTAGFALFGLLDWSAVLMGPTGMRRLGGRLVLLIATWLFFALLGALVQYRLVAALVAAARGGRKPGAGAAAAGPVSGLAPEPWAGGRVESASPVMAAGMAAGAEARAAPRPRGADPGTWLGRLRDGAVDAWRWLRGRLVEAWRSAVSLFRRPRTVASPPAAPAGRAPEMRLASRSTAAQATPAVPGQAAAPPGDSATGAGSAPGSRSAAGPRRGLVVALAGALGATGILLLIVVAAGSAGSQGQLLAVVAILGLIALTMVGLVVAVRRRRAGPEPEGLIARIQGLLGRGPVGEGHQ